MKEKGYRRLPEQVKLASGEWSFDFIDGKKALAKWSDLRVACEAIVEEVSEAGHQFDAVGGLTLGADALAVGVAAVSDTKWFFVRKEPKKRGTRRLIEGASLGKKDRVLLVDDVVTTGGSIFNALKAIEETEAKVVAAVTLVDRGDSAEPRFKEKGIAYFPMANYKDLEIEPVRSKRVIQ
ncbi:MAG: phosphoribosyltransferase family protein [bacterium]|nr:phosphoribosyltransferase family protein [bacterium]